MEGYKLDLLIDPPLCNAPGSLGFAPDTRKPVHWAQFGAFFTNPVSWQARSPAGGDRFQELPGGFMLHTGYPNPGFARVARQYSGVWARAEMPVVVHLLVEGQGRLRRMVERLEGLENVQAIELGFPPDVESAEVIGGVQAAMGELPVIAMLPFETAVHQAGAALGAGASAVSLAPPRVLLPSGDGLASGRMYGRAVFPLMLERVQRLVQAGVPIIAGGGVYSTGQIEALLSMGVKAVQLGTALWRDPDFEIYTSNGNQID